MSKRTPKNSKIEHNTPVVLCWHLKFFDRNKWQYRFVHKGGTFRTETIRLVVRSYGFWEAYTQTCPKWDKKFTTTCQVPLHDTIPCFMNFRWVLDLLEFKNQVSQRFAGNQQCPGVCNSFPVLAWDLSMHPRTHISFFNQFICTGECACS